ncbi:MAG TPA: hypothetical protein VMF08_07420 [Candidatus Sulfotelmatobacter sp.]|nr:hypothetical protein [Candidatus Sulfotelmatobacter sp.]
MVETEQTKVCPLCAETIKAAAKVCPYCRKSQRRWTVLSQYDFGAILVILIILWSLHFSERILYHERDFGLDRDKVQVTSFHVAPVKELLGTNLIMVGVLTNGSGYSWRIQDFQVRYLDKDRQLLGVSEPFSEAFTVLPGTDHSFRLNLFSPKSVPNYDTCLVQVVSASDPRWATESTKNQ